MKTVIKAEEYRQLAEAEEYRQLAEMLPLKYVQQMTWDEKKQAFLQIQRMPQLDVYTILGLSEVLHQKDSMLEEMSKVKFSKASPTDDL